MAGATTPDGIVYAVTGDNVTIAASSSALAGSVQAAFNSRQRYEYVWANAAARAAQTGMVTGATGYQVDTKSEYIYESSAWRLKTSYAEYNHASQSMPTGTGVVPTPFTVVTANTTDTTFTTPGTGLVTFAQPGIYSLSWFITLSAGGGTQAFGAIYNNASLATTAILTLSGFTQVFATVVLPFYRITAANTSLYFQMAQYSGSTLTGSSVLRIGRLG